MKSLLSVFHPEDPNDLDERLNALRRCRRKLNEQSRFLVEMRYDQGVSFARIAERTGRSIQSIYKRMSRIQSTLLRCIEQTLQEAVLP